MEKVAFVTGSSSGIGRSIAVALAGNGYDLAINYNSNEAAAKETERLVREAGAERVLLLRADVSQEDQVRDMIQELDRFFGGRLDVLVNNSGTTSDVPPADFDRMEAKDFERVFAVNVLGTFLVTKHAVRLLRARPRADIINTASIVGLRPGPQPLPYSASKAAIISMTQTLAGALGPAIRVNAVAPGWLEGEWMERALGENYERLMARRAKMTPLKRCAKPEDVGEAVVALVNTLRFSTGQTIVIDGGYSAVT